MGLFVYIVFISTQGDQPFFLTTITNFKEKINEHYARNFIRHSSVQ